MTKTNWDWGDTQPPIKIGNNDGPLWGSRRQSNPQDGGGTNNLFSNALSSIESDEKFKLKPAHIMWGIGGLIFIISLFTGGLDEIGEMRSRGKALSEERQAMQENQNRLKLSQIEMEESAVFAEARYLAGCVVVVATTDPDTLVSIIEGEPVRDGTTNRNLPSKTVVCDTDGNTGVIGADGNVTDVAFTGNLALVRQSLEAMGWTFRESETLMNESRSSQGEQSNNFDNQFGG